MFKSVSRNSMNVRIVIIQRVTISSTCYHTRYQTRYRTFSLGLTWIEYNRSITKPSTMAICVTIHFLSVQYGLEAICNELPLVTFKFIKKKLLIIFKKD